MSGLWFVKFPAAGRHWGNMIWATLIVRWTLTADEDYLSEVAGEVALNLWNEATKAANSVLPPQARFHPRRTYPYTH